MGFWVWGELGHLVVWAILETSGPKLRLRYQNLGCKSLDYRSDSKGFGHPACALKLLPWK